MTLLITDFRSACRRDDRTSLLETLAAAEINVSVAVFLSLLFSKEILSERVVHQG